MKLITDYPEAQQAIKKERAKSRPHSNKVVVQKITHVSLFEQG